MHRILKTVDPMRAGFVHHNECHSKTIDLGPSVVTREQLRLEHDEMAVKNAIRVLELYPVHTEHPDAYRKVSKNMILVEEGKKYTVS